MIGTYSHDGKEIDKELYQLLVPQLTHLQVHAAWKAANVDERGIIWWKIGEGKTRIALMWMFMIAREPRPLIICSPGAFRQWLDEITTLRINDLVKPRFVSCGSLSQKWTVPDIDFQKYNCVVVDELWMYKNPESQRSKLVKQITKKKPTIGLSGSLMTAGNLEDLFGQAKAMNLDKKVAGSMTSFREQFLINTTNWAGFIQRYPRKGAIEAIQRRLIDNIDVNFPKEGREIRDIPINIEPTKEQLDVKRKLLKTYSYENENANFSLEIKTAASLLVKLQQVSDGFLRDKQGNYILIKSNKASRLKELCTELLDAGERLLIWVGFRKTAEILSKLLPCKTTILSGDGKFNVYGWRDGKVRATIATVGSGASLNDFANIRYSIFYSTSFSTISFQQARGRTNRKSSLHDCSYYYFLSTGKFPDEQIYEMIEDNKGREEIAIRVSNRIIKEWKRENPTPTIFG